MLVIDPNNIARRVLKKLSAYYLQDNLEEMLVNRPGEVWVKMRRGSWEVKQAPEIDYEYLHKVCKVLANINSAKFSEDDLPVVSCELPGAPYRFQAIMGPNVRYDLDDRRGVAVAIRALTADTSIDFSSYGLFSDTILPGALSALTEFDVSSDHIQALSDVIARHESLLVSGATSTGKTTFTNMLIDMIDHRERVITVEDAIELTVPHRNRVRLVVPRNRSANAVDHSTVIDSLVRLTPDWIIAGELSVANAQPVFATMGKGHPVITTVHAGSPEQAIGAFANNMNISGAEMSLSGEALLDTLKSQIGAIIQLDRRDGKRKVVEIDFPSRKIAHARNRG